MASGGRRTSGRPAGETWIDGRPGAQTSVYGRPLRHFQARAFDDDDALSLVAVLDAVACVTNFFLANL